MGVLPDDKSGDLDLATPEPWLTREPPWRVRISGIAPQGPLVDT
jgi:hypothetical protein